MSHFIVLCSRCGATIRQCRCPGPDKATQHEVCEDCSGKAKQTGAGTADEKAWEIIRAHEKEFKAIQ